MTPRLLSGNQGKRPDSGIVIYGTVCHFIIDWMQKNIGQLLEARNESAFDRRGTISQEISERKAGRSLPANPAQSPVKSPVSIPLKMRKGR